MAADPFSIIVNTITLAKFLQTTVTDFVSADGDEQTTVSQIRLSSITLKNFVQVFSRFNDVESSRDDQELIAAVCDTLRPSIENMRRMCAEIHSEQTRLGRLRRKLAWTAYRKSRIEALAAQMSRWSSMFHDLRESLPAHIRQQLSPGSTAPSQGPEEQMRMLSALVGSRATSARDTAVERLQKDIRDITIRGTLGKLRSATYNGRGILVEYKSYESGASPERTAYIQEQIGRLCNFLSLADPITTGILACEGWLTEPQMLRFGLMFKMPPGYALPGPGEASSGAGLTTLRSIIAAGTSAASDPAQISYTPVYALNKRIETACMIAVAVFHLHTYNWVHENLRTENIVMLAPRYTPDQSPDVAAHKPLGRPFLIGFDGARSVEGIYSVGQIDEGSPDAQKVARDLFEHPDRQEPTSSDRMRFQMCHDQYSLGVVLLEIGMWMPLEKEKTLRRLREGSVSGCREDVRNALMQLAKTKLAVTMGEKYRSIVLACLGVQTSDDYCATRFLYDVVTPLWEMKSALA